MMLNFINFYRQLFFWRWLRLSIFSLTENSTRHLAMSFIDSNNEICVTQKFLVFFSDIFLKFSFGFLMKKDLSRPKLIRNMLKIVKSMLKRTSKHAKVGLYMPQNLNTMFKRIEQYVINNILEILNGK